MKRLLPFIIIIIVCFLSCSPASTSTNEPIIATCKQVDELQQKIKQLNDRIDFLNKASESQNTYHIYMNMPNYGQYTTVFAEPFYITDSNKGINYKMRLYNHTDGVVQVVPYFLFEHDYQSYVKISSIDFRFVSEDNSAIHLGIVTDKITDLRKDQITIMRFGGKVGGIETTAFLNSGGDTELGGFYIDANNPRDFNINISNIISSLPTSWKISVFYNVTYMGQLTRTR